MRLVAGIILVMASLAMPLRAQAQIGVSGVAHVIDGDTIHLTTDEAEKVVKVRLQGVAAPERGHAGGLEATQFVEQLAEGRQVRCKLDGSRSKDRVVGVCFVEVEGVSKEIGAAVIEAGLARDCPRFSGGRYKTLEKPEAAGLPYPSYCIPRPSKVAR